MTAASTTYDLRLATAADHDVIAEIWQVSASLPGVGPPVMPTPRELRARVDVEMSAGWTVTVATKDAMVVAFLALKPREAVLDQLFVHPSLIGSGLGRMLFAHAMEAMPGGFTLFTASTNASARRFYEKAGMIRLRESAHPRTGHPVTHYGWSPKNSGA